MNILTKIKKFFNMKLECIFQINYLGVLKMERRLRGCVLLLFFFVCCSGLFAQSHNNEQRLVGGWVIENDRHPSSRSTGSGAVLTINTDGTFTIGGNSGKWAINGNNIAFWGNIDFAGSYSFYLTPNGRSLFVPGLAEFQKR
jgi:hypothetical protein